MEKLELINGDYFDPKAAMPFTQHKPGYVTSIRQHKKKMLLCREIDNKILRTDTVFNQMEEIVKRGGANASFNATLVKVTPLPSAHAPDIISAAERYLMLFPIAKCDYDNVSESGS